MNSDPGYNNGSLNFRRETVSRSLVALHLEVLTDSGLHVVRRQVEIIKEKA